VKTLLLAMAMGLASAVWAESPAHAEPPRPIPSPAASDAEGDGEAGPGAAAGVIEYRSELFEDALKELARRAQMNIVISDDARFGAGLLTMRIEGKTPREALEILVKSKDRVLAESGGVHYLMTPDEAASHLEFGPRIRAEHVANVEEKLREAGVSETAIPALLAAELHVQVLRDEKARRPVPPVDADAVEGLFEGLSGLIEGFSRMAAGALLHSILALCVFFNARRIEGSGGGLVFLGPLGWCVVTLLGGLFAAFGYWIIHHSTLSRRVASQQDP
jgi:hypothetical protein